MQILKLWENKHEFARSRGFYDCGQVIDLMLSTHLLVFEHVDSVCCDDKHARLVNVVGAAFFGVGGEKYRFIRV